MKSGASDLVNAIHSVRQAYEHFGSFQRENPGTIGARLMKQYCAKLEWIYGDIITYPLFPQVIRDGIRAEWESDVFTTLAIQEKIAKLSPKEREVVETIIDCIIAGDDITVEKSKEDASHKSI